ncbi:MAG TPA: NADH-quinone oxidoreductase subunit J [Pyrinomonadaceae bacterium]|jgi:NADH-quinone oxidoreductase subunit J
MFESITQIAPYIFFFLLAGLAIGSAIAVVAQRNPLYSAISLIGVFVALAGLYLTLAAPFIAVVQIIVYAGAIMVLVVFVIMLLNVETEDRRPLRLRSLVPIAVLLAAVLFAEAAFIFYFVNEAPAPPSPVATLNPSSVGLTASIGAGLFTTYLLPFEITSILILMALVGAMSLARRSAIRPTDVVVPGAAVLPRQTFEPARVGDATPVRADTTTEAAALSGLWDRAHEREDD